jgi:hypothetical protein
MLKTRYESVTKLHEEIYGRTITTSTRWRWEKKGRIVNGKVRTLRTVRVGGRTCTTPEWLREFLETHNDPMPASERGPTAKQLERSQAAAEAFLTAEKI